MCNQCNPQVCLSQWYIDTHQHSPSHACTRGSYTTCALTAHYLLHYLRTTTQGAAHVVLVGDHCQLPPVVLSPSPPAATTTTHPLSVSLFERLMSAGAPSAMLQVQYRMHPALAAFPSARFYAGRLGDGVTGGERAAPPGLPWPAPAHGPLMVVDVRGSEVRGLVVIGVFKARAQGASS